eukprot:COSAG03_NODE_27412_length_253_cov_0.675325_1_plen_53_part_01
MARNHRSLPPSTLLSAAERCLAAVESERTRVRSTRDCSGCETNETHAQPHKHL